FVDPAKALPQCLLHAANKRLLGVIQALVHDDEPFSLLGIQRPEVAAVTIIVQVTGFLAAGGRSSKPGKPTPCLGDVVSQKRPQRTGRDEVGAVVLVLVGRRLKPESRWQRAHDLVEEIQYRLRNPLDIDRAAAALLLGCPRQRFEEDTMDRRDSRAAPKVLQ